jgi:hypothetical protein
VVITKWSYVFSKDKVAFLPTKVLIGQWRTSNRRWKKPVLFPGSFLMQIRLSHNVRCCKNLFRIWLNVISSNQFSKKLVWFLFPVNSVNKFAVIWNLSNQTINKSKWRWIVFLPQIAVFCQCRTEWGKLVCFDRAASNKQKINQIIKFIARWFHLHYHKN